MKKTVFTYLALSLLLAALTGCTSAPPKSETPPSITLPPSARNDVAPIGDSTLEYIGNATFYLPHKSGNRLISVNQSIAFSTSRPQAESIVRAMMAHPGNTAAASLGGTTQLSLYGANPVEVSLNVATVNLSASALQMNRGDLYLAMQAIANTLTELPGIDFVNFLVVDRAVGLDVANTLPMGALGHSLENNILSIYEQKLTSRVTITDSPADKPLSANATLYFPLGNTPGLLGEVRAVNFANQNLPDMIVLLLNELAQGPSRQDILSPVLSGLGDLLTKTPSAAYSESLGGSIIYLDFSEGLDDFLTSAGVTRANCMASLCYTLSTFLPGTAGVAVTVGSIPVETLMLTESFTSSVLFSDQVLKRSDFAPLLDDLCTLYFLEPESHSLTATKRPVPYYQKQNPRYLLQELAKGPKPCDSIPGLQATLPKNCISDASILGLSKSDHTLLVNFAPDFSAVPDGLTGEEERMLVYSMVNTLCENSVIQNVGFFISGVQPETFSGEIYWPGLFYPMK